MRTFEALSVLLVFAALAAGGCSKVRCETVCECIDAYHEIDVDECVDECREDYKEDDDCKDAIKELAGCVDDDGCDECNDERQNLGDECEVGDWFDSGGSLSGPPE